VVASHRPRISFAARRITPACVGETHAGKSSTVLMFCHRAINVVRPN
jgi:hypothetical protein